MAAVPVAAHLRQDRAAHQDAERICTSIVEPSNLSMRMGMRRFTRLTNAFSKKWGNHWAAVALWYCWYNFGRVHKSLRINNRAGGDSCYDF